MSLTDTDAPGRQELQCDASDCPDIVLFAWVSPPRQQHLRREVESIGLQLPLGDGESACFEEINQESALAVVENRVEVEPVVGETFPMQFSNSLDQLSEEEAGCAELEFAELCHEAAEGVPETQL